MDPASAPMDSKSPFAVTSTKERMNGGHRGMSRLFKIRAVHSLPVRIFRMLSPMPLIGLATFAHATETCIEHPYHSAATEDENGLLAIYQSIAPALGHFPSLSEALAKAAPDLCFSSQMNDAHAYLDFDGNRIVISEGLSKDMQSAVFLHELRHLEQFVRGSCPSDDLAMEAYARATFAMEADASAISLLVAWDMKENGHGSVWAALSSWPSQSDIAASFANEMADTGDVALAATTAFYQWYASSARREQYFFAACSGYLDRQDATHILPLYQLIPDTFLENLCILPDGSIYECSHPEFELR